MSSLRILVPVKKVIDFAVSCDALSAFREKERLLAHRYEKRSRELKDASD